MDIKRLVGKKVEVIRYKMKREIRHVGRLTDVTTYYVCLKKSDGREIWIKRPTKCNGFVRELRA